MRRIRGMNQAVAKAGRRWWSRPARTRIATKVTHGVLGVLRDGEKLLLIRRAACVRVGGVWCFPGGTIERGESEAAALVREMREELGVIVVPEHRLFVLRKHGGRLVLHWWSAKVVDGRLVPNPAEVAEVRWMTP